MKVLVPASTYRALTQDLPLVLLAVTSLLGALSAGMTSGTGISAWIWVVSSPVTAWLTRRVVMTYIACQLDDNATSRFIRLRRTVIGK
jgi:hypothetical protein